MQSSWCESGRIDASGTAPRLEPCPPRQSTAADTSCGLLIGRRPGERDDHDPEVRDRQALGLPGAYAELVNRPSVTSDLADSPQLQAVLFDMDGTLLDSEKVWEIALDELAASLGGRLSAPARASMVGSTLDRSIRILHADVGVAGDEQRSGEFLMRRTDELFRTQLEYRPGAVELLRALRAAAMPMALVTSTQRALTDVALDWMGRSYFDVSVCGDEVVHPKPAAESYQRAAQLLGVDPRMCVAVEDSPIGIAAAEAAQCAVLAVPSEVPIEPAPTRTVRDSLVGVDLPALSQVLHRRLALAAR